MSYAGQSQIMKLVQTSSEFVRHVQHNRLRDRYLISLKLDPHYLRFEEALEKLQEYLLEEKKKQEEQEASDEAN